jgi:hypothetical protein
MNTKTISAVMRHLGKKSAVSLSAEQRKQRAVKAGKAGGRDRYYITERDGGYTVSRGCNWAVYYIEDGKIWMLSGEDTPSKRRALARFLGKENK